MTRKNVKVNGRRMSCLYVKNVPATLKSYFKAYCAKQEKTMTQEIIEHMLNCTKTARNIADDADYGSES